MLPTVAEVLALDPLRRGAPRVVAAADGLDAPVRWVHVIELAEAAHLLRGGELVLATGIALPDDPSGLTRYVADLAVGRGQRAGRRARLQVRPQPPGRAGFGGVAAPAAADRARAGDAVHRGHRSGARADHRRPARGAARLGAAAPGVHRPRGVRRASGRGGAAGRGAVRAAGDPGEPGAPGGRVRGHRAGHRPAARRVRGAVPRGRAAGADRLRPGVRLAGDHRGRARRGLGTADHGARQRARAA